MQFSIWKNIFVVLIMSAILSSGGLSIMEVENENNFLNKATAAVSNNVPAAQNIIPELPVYVPPKKLANPPEIVKAVYMTGYSAGSKKYLNYLENLFQTTEINSVVIDIKGSGGDVSYVIKNNIDGLVNFFHDRNIYVIGRIAVFEDPVYSKAHPEFAIYDKLWKAASGELRLWRDNNGQSWLDPASKDVWDYNISLAKNALYHGFDEINFDYIRFPSDGNIKNMGFPVWDKEMPMAGVIENFFYYLRSELSGEIISVDLFGQTTIDKNDMGIGQMLESAFENFDFISPMLYPSHYANGFIGFKNPAEHPYEVVKYSLDSALSRKKYFFNENGEAIGTPAEEAKAYSPVIKLAKFRPWLQDFNMGAVYTAEMVKKEIKATQDSLGTDYKGFMLWNPNNIYTN